MDGTLIGRQWHRVILGALVLYCAALITTLLVTLYRNVMYASINDQQAAHFNTALLHQSGQRLMVEITADSLSPSGHSMSGTISFVAPQSIMQDLRLSKKQPVFRCGFGVPCVAGRIAKGAPVGIQVLARGNGQELAAIFQTTTTFASLFSDTESTSAPTLPVVRAVTTADYSFTHTYHFTYLVAGNPDSYPGDDYILTPEILISIPNVYYKDHRPVPVSASFQSGPRIAGFEPIYLLGQAHSDLFLQRWSRPVTWKRSPWFQIYTYLFALVPFVFSLVFLHLLFWNRGYSATELRDFLAAIVAAVLAVLPLRLILVPNNIGGTTRVDLLLGLGLASLLCVCTARYVRDSWQSDAKETESANV